MNTDLAFMLILLHKIQCYSDAKEPIICTGINHVLYHISQVNPDNYTINDNHALLIVCL